MLAEAPQRAPTFVVTRGASRDPEAVVWFWHAGRLHRSPSLSKIVNGIAPGQFLPTLALGATELAPRRWLLRIVAPPPDPSSSEAQRPCELLITGDPRVDHWRIVAWSPSVFQRRWIHVPGERLPWSNMPNTSFNPAQLSLSGRTVVALVADGEASTAYVSRDQGVSWQRAKR